MIYTVTFNPALDYTINSENFKINEINLSQNEYIFLGGKGINVSIILKNLDIESTAIGFVGGFVGKEIERQINKLGVKTEFIKIKNQNSRINIKILGEKTETAINCKGPYVNKSHIKSFYKKIEMIENGDILVLSGSIPKGIEENIYEQICEKLKNKNIKFIVDSTGELLLNTLKYKPFLIKPNRNELEEIFQTKILNKDEAIKYAKKLQLKGAKNVLISLGENGAVLLDENGKVYKKEAIKSTKAINTVGAGDSMVAGFIAGYLKYGDYEKSLKMGIAAATATVDSIFLGTKEEIIEYFEKK